MVFYVHEAESIFLVKGNSLQICVNSQESATGVPPDCHCEPRRGEAIPIQKSKFILKQVIPLGILRLYWLYFLFPITSLYLLFSQYSIPYILEILAMS